MSTNLIKRLEAARGGSSKPQADGAKVFNLGPEPKRWPSAARSAYWDVVRALNDWGKDNGQAFGVYDNLVVANRAIRESWGYQDG